MAMYEHLSEKLEKDYSITLREREFVEEYEALLQTMGKDAVIRRENKTKPRKKKTASSRLCSRLGSVHRSARFHFKPHHLTPAYESGTRFMLRLT